MGEAYFGLSVSLVADFLEGDNALLAYYPFASNIFFLGAAVLELSSVLEIGFCWELPWPALIGLDILMFQLSYLYSTLIII